VLEVDRPRPCPRCDRLAHASPLDDPLPPWPVIEADGTLYLELGLVLKVLRDVRAAAVLGELRSRVDAGRRTVAA
jgi:hypothetical protein